jgi:hypothetical protein
MPGDNEDNDRLSKLIKHLKSKLSDLNPNKEVAAGVITGSGVALTEYMGFKALRGTAAADPWLTIIEKDGHIHRYDKTYVIHEYVVGEGALPQKKLDEIHKYTYDNPRRNKAALFYAEHYDKAIKARIEYMDPFQTVMETGDIIK